MESKLLIVFVLSLYCFCNVYCKALPISAKRHSSDDDGVDFQKILKNIPEDERVEYLKFQVMAGYQAMNSEDKTNSKFDPLTPEITQSILQYFYEKHKITNDHENSFLQKVVCLPDVGCADLDDPTVHP